MNAQGPTHLASLAYHGNQECLWLDLGKIWIRRGKPMEKEVDMPLALYFHLSRREQKDNLRLSALFLTFPLNNNNFIFCFVIIY